MFRRNQLQQRHFEVLWQWNPILVNLSGKTTLGRMLGNVQHCSQSLEAGGKCVGRKQDSRSCYRRSLLLLTRVLNHSLTWLQDLKNVIRQKHLFGPPEDTCPCPICQEWGVRSDWPPLALGVRNETWLTVKTHTEDGSQTEGEAKEPGSGRVLPALPVAVVCVSSPQFQRSLRGWRKQSGLLPAQIGQTY